MKPTFFVLTPLSALVAAAPVHASTPISTSPSLPPLPTSSVSVSGSGSGQMFDNMLPDNDLPGGGIGSSSNTANKRALANAVPDTFDSSTYYEAAAEKEAEELALALDAASDNIEEDEGAVDSVNTNKRQRSGRGRTRGNDVVGCRKYTPATCEKCQREWEIYQACLCDSKASTDACVQGKRQYYDVCAKKECS